MLLHALGQIRHGMQRDQRRSDGLVLGEQYVAVDQLLAAGVVTVTGTTDTETQAPHLFSNL